MSLEYIKCKCKQRQYAGFIATLTAMQECNLYTPQEIHNLKSLAITAYNQGTCICVSDNKCY